ncbi:MAG: 1-acyl-sn-glycerol-3-phosphate acyltransferase [Acidobacteriota bacterium]
MNSLPNWLMKSISKAYYRATGWRVEGRIPSDIPRCMIIGVPHTSNYDFGYARGLFYIIDRPVKYIVKEELLQTPLGWFFKATGAIGVSRDKSQNMVARMVELFESSENMCILLSPEGSRQSSGKWRTGFYYAALQAQVPIVLATLDYKKKTAYVGFSVYPTGDYEQDMEQVKEYFQGITPKNMTS